MSASSPPRPPGTLRFGRVAGADLLARPSLLFMGLVLVLLLAPRFSVQAETDPYLLAAIFVLALYVSVLVHELAHLAAARAYGMTVRSVTLHLLGGETSVDGESRTPGQELVTSVVGPLASLGIGLAAHALAQDTGGVAGDLLWSIGWVNVLVAVFNLLPGLPLDGGRVVRAVIWAVSGSERTGIVVTAWIGRYVAVGVVAFVLYRVVTGDVWSTAWVFDLLLAGFVALFLWSGATASLRVADRSARINALRADDLADPLPEDERTVDALPRLPVGVHGATLLRAMAARPADLYLLVDAADRPVAVLRATAVDEAYRKEA